MDGPASRWVGPLRAHCRIEAEPERDTGKGQRHKIADVITREHSAQRPHWLSPIVAYPDGIASLAQFLATRSTSARA